MGFAATIFTKGTVRAFAGDKAARAKRLVPQPASDTDERDDLVRERRTSEEGRERTAEQTLRRD